MEDVDQLSNAEYRTKVESQGLPQLLRASLAESPKKSPDQCDTLQPSTSSVALETPYTRTEDDSVIVLESDGKEDEKMLKTVAKAEQELQRSHGTQSSTTTLEDDFFVVLDTDDEQEEETVKTSATLEQEIQRRHKTKSPKKDDSFIVLDSDDKQEEEMLQVPVPAPVTSQSASQGAVGSSSSNYLNTHSRHYDRYTKTNPGSATGRRHSQAVPPYQLTPDYEVQEESQYQSAFARNLARLRAKKMADCSIGYTLEARCRPHARRAPTPEGLSVSTAFSNWINSLDEKYGLELIIFISVVILMLIGVYKIFY
ncbi:otefin-like [Drosophila tropicalis]|uniref:otefin-like n=1 Tax=Drosophila tropicalis TaxID=46794 RepID=UPI0035AC0410